MVQTRPKVSPFRRDSVDVGRHGREWVHDVPVSSLKPGDSILGLGSVFSAQRGVRLGEVEYMMFQMSSGNTADFGIDETVTAFIVNPSE